MAIFRKITAAIVGAAAAGMILLVLRLTVFPDPGAETAPRSEENSREPRLSSDRPTPGESLPENTAIEESQPPPPTEEFHPLVEIDTTHEYSAPPPETAPAEPSLPAAEPPASRVISLQPASAPAAGRHGRGDLSFFSEIDSAGRKTRPPTADPAADLSERLSAARATARNGDLPAAVTLYRGLAADYPKRKEILAEYAAVLRATGHYRETIPVYLTMIDGDGDKYTRHNLALAYARTGNFRKAESTYRDLVNDHPGFLEARSNLAGIYQLEGKLQQALDQWTSILADHPDLYAAHFSIGEIKMKTDEYRKAMAHFSTAAKLRPDHAPPWINFAAAAVRIGSCGRAAVALKRAFASEGLGAEGYELLGDKFLEVFRKTEEQELLGLAITSWKKAQSLQPANEGIHEKLERYEAMIEPGNGKANPG